MLKRILFDEKFINKQLKKILKKIEKRKIFSFSDQTINMQTFKIVE